MTTEIENIVTRYERRKQGAAQTYDPLRPEVLMARQEKERALIRWIRTCGIAPVAERRLLEIGCGSGVNLLSFLQLGFRPENMVGNELLPERARASQEVLPNELQIRIGDALTMAIPETSFHIVFQSTVFTSILNMEFQEALARRMWLAAKPGGGVLWYDFVYDNPGNADVRGIPMTRIRQLFPHGRMWHMRVTLAPPISRIVTPLASSLYTVFNSLPALRTHVLCWIQKKG